MHPEWENAKQRYHSIQPPEGLSAGVEEAVRRGDQARRRHTAFRRSLTTALAGCACFILLVNASPTFAQAVSGVPVRLPGLADTGNEALEERINHEIDTRVQALVDEAEQQAQEERDAYLATGGDPADYMPVMIDADYVVEHQPPASSSSPTPWTWRPART